MARHLPLALYGLLGVACDRTTLSDVEPIVPSTIQDTRTFTVSGILFETMPDGSRRRVPDVGILRESHVREGWGRRRFWLDDRQRGPLRDRDLAGRQPGVGRGVHRPVVSTVHGNGDDDRRRQHGNRDRSSRSSEPNPPQPADPVGHRLPDRDWRPASTARGARGAFHGPVPRHVLARTYTDAEDRYELCRLPNGPGCVTVNMSHWDLYAEHRTQVSIDGSARVDIHIPSRLKGHGRPANRLHADTGRDAGA